jgi:hypothetical protein
MHATTHCVCCTSPTAFCALTCEPGAKHPSIHPFKEDVGHPARAGKRCRTTVARTSRDGSGNGVRRFPCTTWFRRASHARHWRMEAWKHAWHLCSLASCGKAQLSIPLPFLHHPIQITAHHVRLCSQSRFASMICSRAVAGIIVSQMPRLRKCQVAAVALECCM